MIEKREEERNRERRKRERREKEKRERERRKGERIYKYIQVYLEEQPVSERWA